MHNHAETRLLLPYLDEKELAQGSFGSIYRVKIEKDHRLSKDGKSANIEPVELARKDFKVQSEHVFAQEQKALQQIMAHPTRHESITVAEASLQLGDAYNLFFPLASCNLWHYLSGSSVPPVSAPCTLNEKRAIFRRGIALAGAQAFLHDNFTSRTTLHNLACYHLDLKPHNILVLT